MESIAGRNSTWISTQQLQVSESYLPEQPQHHGQDKEKSIDYTEILYMDQRKQLVQLAWLAPSSHKIQQLQQSAEKKKIVNYVNSVQLIIASNKS